MVGEGEYVKEKGDDRRKASRKKYLSAIFMNASLQRRTVTEKITSYCRKNCGPFTF